MDNEKIVAVSALMNSLIIRAIKFGKTGSDSDSEVLSRMENDLMDYIKSIVPNQD